jgi:hypothetical protein
MVVVVVVGYIVVLIYCYWYWYYSYISVLIIDVVVSLYGYYILFFFLGRCYRSRYVSAMCCRTSPSSFLTLLNAAKTEWCRGFHIALPHLLILF